MTVVETYAPGRFCWVDLGTSDAPAAKRFYTGLFGWTAEDRPTGEAAVYESEHNTPAVDCRHQPGGPPSGFAGMAADETEVVADEFKLRLGQFPSGAKRDQAKDRSEAAVADFEVQPA